MQYGYIKPSEHWRRANTVSLGICEVGQTKDGQRKLKGAFLRIRAHGHEYDKLCVIAEVVKKALNVGEITEFDFKTKIINIWKLCDFLADKGLVKEISPF